MQDELSKVPGAHLDSLRVHVLHGRAQVDVSSRAPREIPPSFVAETQSRLAKRLKMPADLEIGTVLSSYVTPTGSLYKNENVLLEQTEKSLKTALEQFSGADLEFFRTTDIPERFSWRNALMLSIRSSYVFDSELVAQLRQSAESQLEKLSGKKWILKLTVRTTLSQVFTETGRVANDLERKPSPQEVQQVKVETVAREALGRLLLEYPGAWLESVQVDAMPVEDVTHPFLTWVRCELATPRLIPQSSVDALADELRGELDDSSLRVLIRVHTGREMRAAPFRGAASWALSVARLAIPKKAPAPRPSPNAQSRPR